MENINPSKTESDKNKTAKNSDEAKNVDLTPPRSLYIPPPSNTRWPDPIEVDEYYARTFGSNNFF